MTVDEGLSGAPAALRAESLGEGHPGSFVVGACVSIDGSPTPGIRRSFVIALPRFGRRVATRLRSRCAPFLAPPAADVARAPLGPRSAPGCEVQRGGGALAAHDRGGVGGSARGGLRGKV